MISNLCFWNAEEIENDMAKEGVYVTILHIKHLNLKAEFSSSNKTCKQILDIPFYNL